ncbi:hypothetical protein DFP72DRAFT_1060158 [Ephemerocybe angulata]|uniref:Telomere replication protein EST3 n=1 Tax=Ephemerocybe angulata TaxID=980116 RepID=A0A8H6ICD7_9AGAR|nr:hypothetical protein DFP72DRAFT_1060158 [Tulosesus angulatus]
MTTDILKPWLAAYLVAVGEEYGADVASIKWCRESQKGQVIRFLTDQTKPHVLWGMFSDGEYSLPIKIAKDAVGDDHNIVGTFMEECCILTVKQYKPIFCRAPRGGNSGLSEHSRLVLECEIFTRSARTPQSILGGPKSITSHADLNAWSEGLKQHGGGGNVLKLRREALAAAPQMPSPPHSPPPPAEGKKPKLLTKSKVYGPNELLHLFEGLAYNDKPFDARPVRPSTPKASPATPKREATVLSSSPEIPVTEWGSSPPRHRPPPSPSPSAHAVSRRINPSQVLLSDTDMGEVEAPEQAPSSSLPIESQRTVDENTMDIDPEQPISYEQPYPTESRKVPRPPSPKRLPRDGLGKILVPNSDVSMAGSSQPSQEPKVVRRALSQRDINAIPMQQRQHPAKRTIPQSQEDNRYDGDEESVEKHGLARAGKKNRAEGRSENGRPKSKPRRRERLDMSDDDLPPLTMRQITDIMAAIDRERGL